MTKKKKPTNTISAEPIEQIDPTPPEEFPSIQVEEMPVEQPTEPEPVAEVEPHPTVQVVAEPAPAVELVVEVKPQPVIEPTPVVAEHKTESIPSLPPKPKTLTLAYLQEEFETLMEIIELHSALITELQESQARKRKAPTSNGKIQIRDKQTGKIYPSKNNVYQSLLKSGELKDLVDKGIFGAIPEKNNFGCYVLFRAYPDRFEEVHEEQSV
jgi:hypothetical protein